LTEFTGTNINSTIFYYILFLLQFILLFHFFQFFQHIAELFGFPLLVLLSFFCYCAIGKDFEG